MLFSKKKKKQLPQNNDPITTSLLSFNGIRYCKFSKDSKCW